MVVEHYIESGIHAIVHNLLDTSHPNDIYLAFAVGMDIPCTRYADSVESGFLHGVDDALCGLCGLPPCFPVKFVAEPCTGTSF